MMNANFTKTLVNRTPAIHTYTVENIEGMTKDEIIDACDPYNFGGCVYGHTVEVYVD